MRRRNKQQYGLYIPAILCVLAALFCMFPTLGWAQDTIQNLIINPTFTCLSGLPVGDIFLNANNQNICFTTDGVGFFERLLCVFHSLINEIMVKLYCGTVGAIQLPVTALATVFIASFATMFMLGIVEFSAREAMIALLKVALVMSFALNAELAIGVGYNFFVTFASQMTSLFLTAISPNTGGQMLTVPDAMISNVSSVLTGQGDPSGTLDIPTRCEQALITIFVVTMLLMPMLGLMLLGALFAYFMLFARMMFGYLYAFAMISFLFALSPIFISFALFSVTRQLFQHWLHYLQINTMQIVLVFAFIAIIEQVDFVKFIVDTFSLLRVYKWEFLGIPMGPFSIDTCSVCEYTMNADGKPVCNDCTSVTQPDGSVVTTCTGTATALAPWTALGDGNLIQYFITNLLALFILGWVLEKFLILAPIIAKELSGDGTAATLGGTPAKLSAVGMDMLNTPGFGRLESGIAGFRNAAGVAALPRLYWPQKARSKKGYLTYPMRLFFGSTSQRRTQVADVFRKGYSEFKDHGKTPFMKKREQMFAALRQARRAREIAEMKQQQAKEKHDAQERKRQAAVQAKTDAREAAQDEYSDAAEKHIETQEAYATGLITEEQYKEEYEEGKNVLATLEEKVKDTIAAEKRQKDVRSEEHDKARVELEKRDKILELAKKEEQRAQAYRDGQFLDKRKKHPGFMARTYEKFSGKDYRYAADIWKSGQLLFAQEMASHNPYEKKPPETMDDLRKRSSYIDKWHTRLFRNNIIWSPYTDMNKDQWEAKLQAKEDKKEAKAQKKAEKLNTKMGGTKAPKT